MNAIEPENRRNQAPEVKPWVRRLVEGQRLSLNEKAMAWWSFHLDGFLSYAVKRGERLEVVILGRGYLQMLQETLPSTAGFRLDQTKQALRCLFAALIIGIGRRPRKAPSGLDSVSSRAPSQRKVLLHSKKVQPGGSTDPMVTGRH